MAGRARSKSKGRRDGVTLQLPSHVQNSLNKEERVLQQTLLDIDRETKHRLKCISQDQQVAARKLTTLERRLLISQSRSKSATGVGTLDRKKLMSRMDTCDSGYFKSLMTPAFKDTAEMFAEEQLNIEIGVSPKKLNIGVQSPPKSALKKERSAGVSSDRSTTSADSTVSRKKSVSFNSRRVTKI